MTPMEISSAGQKSLTQLTTVSVTSTAAADSARTRTNAAAERYAALSATTTARADEPRRPSWTSSAARCRDRRDWDDSAAAITNATTMPANAARSLIAMLFTESV